MRTAGPGQPGPAVSFHALRAGSRAVRAMDEIQGSLSGNEGPSWRVPRPRSLGPEFLRLAHHLKELAAIALGSSPMLEPASSSTASKLAFPLCGESRRSIPKAATAAANRVSSVGVGEVLALVLHRHLDQLAGVAVGLLVSQGDGHQFVAGVLAVEGDLVLILQGTDIRQVDRRPPAAPIS